MRRSILRRALLLSVVTLISTLAVVLGVTYGFFSLEQERQLSVEMELAARAVERDGIEYLQTVKTRDCRITWIAADGLVIYDTGADANNMENHLDREEVARALVSGTGRSARNSATLMTEMVYLARLMPDGTVLRVAASRATALAMLYEMLPPVALIALVASACSALLARGLARRVVAPLNDLDLDHPLENDAYEELSPLLGRINRQHEQIEAQLNELKRKTDEFDRITASMTEGLVLLDAKGRVLSLNESAQRFFGVDQSYTGMDFLAVDRGGDIDTALKKAMAEGRATARVERRGREYDFDITRVESDGVQAGAAMIIFDVTETARAEEYRRQFAANVSHELKTPLQSIMGSAELIENGLVSGEDMPLFASRIRSESRRLVSLIDDIIHLSRLDEGVQAPLQRVDIHEIAIETASSLKDAADEKNVAINVTGQSASVLGVEALLRDIVYNLCDNAIKYNKQNGHVVLDVARRGEYIALTVTDDGIGIPPEHQPRVFERFYRVDKSHSKQTGGTGLGLSIVKHAASFHHARVNLKSAPGQGTNVTVLFPADDEKPNE